MEWKCRWGGRKAKSKMGNQGDRLRGASGSGRGRGRRAVERGTWREGRKTASTHRERVCRGGCWPSRVLSTKKSHHPCGDPALQPRDRGQSLKPKLLWSSGAAASAFLWRALPPRPPLPDSRTWLMLSSPRPSALGFN